MTHERSKRVEASSSMAFLTGHLKGVDLEHANDVIDFLLAESIGNGGVGVSDEVGSYFLPMSALLFGVIHHDLCSMADDDRQAG